MNFVLAIVVWLALAFAVGLVTVAFGISAPQLFEHPLVAVLNLALIATLWKVIAAKRRKD